MAEETAIPSIQDVRNTAGIPDTVLDTAIQARIDLSVDIVKRLNLESNYSSNYIKRITIQVACHFCVTQISALLQASSEKIGEISYDLSQKFEMGLRGSSYGQAAISMDPSGKLATLDSSASEVDVEQPDLSN